MLSKESQTESGTYLKFSTVNEKNNRLKLRVKRIIKISPIKYKNECKLLN